MEANHQGEALPEANEVAFLLNLNFDAVRRIASFLDGKEILRFAVSHMALWDVLMVNCVWKQACLRKLGIMCQIDTVPDAPTHWFDIYTINFGVGTPHMYSRFPQGHHDWVRRIGGFVIDSSNAIIAAGIFGFGGASAAEKVQTMLESEDFTLAHEVKNGIWVADLHEISCLENNRHLGTAPYYGLSAAYKLKLHGLNVTVFEADGRVGGKLRSVSRDGLIWDEGANTMTESEASVGFLLDNLGLRDKQQFPLSQHKRYIAKNGVPVQLPSNPVALIRSNFLSAGSKLQIFLEPFLWKSNNASKGPDEKESVGTFFQRHFGKEVVDYLIDPFVAGTSGGDPESLSMQHVFPEIWNLEKRHQTQHAVVQHIVPKVKQDDPSSGISPQLLASARVTSQESKVGNQNSPSYRVFTVEELEEATKNFDQSTLLGEGSFGKVYKGRLENGTTVAIRSLTLYRKCSIQNLRMRLDLLSKLRHPHLVVLLGHCIDDGMQDESTVRRLFLVQEFVPNGNFRSHLSENSPEKVLKWPERLAVLIGAAKAVHFLHTGVIPPSLSNRLKTNNILIDEHGIAKLSDYGMSIIADETVKSDAKGDAAKSGHVDKLQDDVHNFGFILLESLVGPITSGKGEAFVLNEMTSFSSQDGRRKIVDPIVLTTSSQESLSIIISITNKCISAESSGRPSFEDVLWNLQYAAQVQATADADQKSDTASHQSFG